MKSLVLFLLYIGIILIAIGYIKSNQRCPPPRVEFRYIPRTFKEEQENPTPVLSVYGSLFSQSSPWQKTQGYDDRPFRRSDFASNIFGFVEREKDHRLFPT